MDPGALAAVLIGGTAYIVFGSAPAAALLGAFWTPLALASPLLRALSIPWWMARDRKLIAAARAARL